MGGGVTGYSSAYMVVGVIAAIMVILTLGLKNQQQDAPPSHRPKPSPQPTNKGKINP